MYNNIYMELAAWKLDKMANYYDNEGFGGALKKRKKRKPTEYNVFFGKERKKGLSPKEIGAKWRDMGGGVAVGGVMVGGKESPWIKCEKKLGHYGSKTGKKLTKAHMSKLYQDYDCDVTKMKMKLPKKGSKSSKIMNPWIACEEKLGHKGLTKKQQSEIYKKSGSKCTLPKKNIII